MHRDILKSYSIFDFLGEIDDDVLDVKMVLWLWFQIVFSL